MKFNRDLFNENVDYCEFVFNECQKNLLDLTGEEIQNIANNYVFELYNRGIDTELEVYEDTELLQSIIDHYFKKKSNFIPELDEDMEEYLYNYKYALERKVNASGGYGFNESYDDVSIEEINDEFSLKYIKKIK